MLQKFFPKTLVKISSPINGEISVVEQWGRRKIVVSGLTQSGPLAEKIWDSGIKNLSSIIHYPSSILILGLGGGSLVKLLNKYFPQAKIIGVEIDPLMAELGQQYLELSKAKNLKIIIDDAINFVKKTNEKFDLIFFDLYIGDKIPKDYQTKFFLKNLKKLLRENGMIVFNCLYFKNHIFEAKVFLDKLRKIFNDVNCKKVLTNLLIFVRENGRKL